VDAVPLVRRKCRVSAGATPDMDRYRI